MACVNQARVVSRGLGFGGSLTAKIAVALAVGLLVRVNYEPVHSHVDQMIKCKSDEWLLKYRDQRLGQILRKRP